MEAIVINAKFENQLTSTIQGLDAASQAAEEIGWPTMARDLAVAMVTVQRFRTNIRQMLEM